MEKLDKRHIVSDCLATEDEGTSNPATSSSSSSLSTCESAINNDISAAVQRPQFGNRFLKNEKDVFQHNAWDNVEWGVEQEEQAESKVRLNSQILFSVEHIDDFEKKADRYWNDFYGQHQNRFFKDRHWLFTEFPELDTSQTLYKTVSTSNTTNSGTTGLLEDKETDTKSSNVNSLNDDLKKLRLPTKGDEECESINSSSVNDRLESAASGDDVGVACSSNPGSSDSNKQPAAGVIQKLFPGHHAKIRFFEVGCGVGNTVFPVIQTNNDPDLFMYCCDLSETAVSLVKDHAEYHPMKCHAFVCDITDENQPYPFPEESLDVIILVFVLSAIKPDRMQGVVDRLSKCLVPGGTILFRDYGRYDMAQLRFKKGKCIGENFYARGDGTQVYFFTQDDLREFFTKAGLVEKQNLIDRRLQVNRGKQLKMYRVWIQCKYCKPLKVPS